MNEKEINVGDVIIISNNRRPDLREEPHGWRMPLPVKHKVRVTEISWSPVDRKINISTNFLAEIIFPKGFNFFQIDNFNGKLEVCGRGTITNAMHQADFAGWGYLLEGKAEIYPDSVMWADNKGSLFFRPTDTHTIHTRPQWVVLKEKK